MRTILFPVAILVTMFTLSANWGHEPDDSLIPFMRAKLDHSKKIMEGMALEDFELISKSAQEMALISQASNWQVLQTMEYRRQSTEFRRSAEALKQAAEKKNLEGCVLAYFEVSMKCVQCHKYVRSVRAASLEVPELQEREFK